MDLTPLSDATLVTNAARLIQIALTPVFMLSAIGTVLNVFNTRLSRVSDHMTHLNDLLKGDLVALVCTVGCLVAFMGDSLLAWHGLRREGPLPAISFSQGGAWKRLISAYIRAMPLSGSA